MERTASLAALLLLAGCGGSAGGTDAALPDAPALDAPAADAPSACEPATWPFQCVQGDPVTHLCTDSMYPPGCVDGTWTCTGGGVPDTELDCWCHVGPEPAGWDHSLCSCDAPDTWTCRFRCGPELLCEAGAEWCERSVSDVAGIPDSYACRAFDPSCASVDCTCVSGVGGAMCEPVENGGIMVTFPGG